MSIQTIAIIDLSELQQQEEAISSPTERQIKLYNSIRFFSPTKELERYAARFEDAWLHHLFKCDIRKCSDK
uniref:Uncharacterized protein n=1 Tax=Onchocerca volvulus TaxID=6282 RepID=A0A8R1XMS5_ONCVO